MDTARVFLPGSVSLIFLMLSYSKGRLTPCLVGALLDVPTHTVNMTTLRSAHDLWQAYSMNPFEVHFVVFFFLLLSRPLT